jgi:hypothetical protein
MCQKYIIAMFPSGTPFPVYCQECWFSDKWDALTFGREYDFSKPFFQQFHELTQVVPQIAVQVNNCPGSEYVNQIFASKNCYMLNSATDNEDCMYSYRILNSKNTLESNFVRYVEYCFQCVHANKLSNSGFVEGCYDSSHLQFCTDMRGSIDCFMSSNLRNASYVFRNKQLTKEEYEEKIKEVDTGSYKKLQELLSEYQRLRESRLYKYANEKNTTNSTGNELTNTTNTKHSFFGSELENCKYAIMQDNTRDCYDLNNGCCETELVYETSTVGVDCYNVKFSADVWPSVTDTSYSQSCRNGVDHLFGCIGIMKKDYCILNKRYTKEEYESLLPKILKHLDEMPYTDSKGRVYKYGEFFPPELSIFSYNETPAQDRFPKNKNEVEGAGFKWHDIEKRHYEVTMKASDLPDHIRDVKDDITKQIIGCSHNGECKHQCPAAFRITTQELKFYREQNLALPRLCPNCRHHERFEMTNPYQLWKRRCQCAGSTSEDGIRRNSTAHFHGQNQCPNEFETSYSPERKETVYCEQCYTSEIA